MPDENAHAGEANHTVNYILINYFIKIIQNVKMDVAFGSEILHILQCNVVIYMRINFIS